MDLQEAIQVLTDALKNDPEYYNGWQANIAINVYDALQRDFSGSDKNVVLSLCNKGAANFLNMLMVDNKDDAKPSVTNEGTPTNEWCSKHNSKCLDNAADNEPIFVLRAQDKSSPKVILHWIEKNFETCPDDKLRDAFEATLLMKNWPGRKKAD